MATINFYLKGKKNPSPIYIRVAEGKSIDLWEKVGVYVNPDFWDQKKQQLKKFSEVNNLDEINITIKKLEIFIFEEFNSAYITGQVINKIWLAERIKAFFNRPKEEKNLVNLDRNIYLSDYAQYWINNKAKSHKVSASKYMDSTTVAHYQQVVDNIKEFEGRDKIMLRHVDSDVMDSFSNFLTQDQEYATATAKRKIGRFKFFCERAEVDNLEVNKNFKNTVFIKEQEIEYKQPYLNEDEINKIFKFKLVPNCPMDHVRDNLIIGLWSSLRVSDFLTRLSVSNIENGFIRIKTMKTKTFVNIPIHHQVAYILNKRNGSLPDKISEQHFNEQIKILARIVGIDDLMIGGVVKVDKKTKTKRKVIDTYKKWELMTSHVCRRSFCTNLFGKVDDSVIMSVAGWKSKDQMYAYNKTTNMDSANILKEYWNKIYN